MLQTFKHLRLFGYSFSQSLNTCRQLNVKTVSVMSGKEALSVLSTAPTFLFCVLSSTLPIVECSLYISLDSQPVYKISMAYYSCQILYKQWRTRNINLTTFLCHHYRLDSIPISRYLPAISRYRIHLVEFLFFTYCFVVKSCTLPQL